VDRANRTHVRTLFPPKNRENIPHVNNYQNVDFLTPSVSMFIGQGLSLETRCAAQAKRRTANTTTATAAASSAASTAASTAVAVATNRASSVSPSFFALYTKY